MIDNIDRLAKKVKEIQRLAYLAQHPSNVGASKGILTGDNTVIVGIEELQAYFACDAPNTEGTPVWVQRDGRGGAVVIGVAF